MIAALGDAPDGKLSDGALKERFGARYNDLVPILNELLGQNRLELYSSSGKGQGLSVCEYKLVDEQTASVLAALMTRTGGVTASAAPPSHVSVTAHELAGRKSARP